VASRTVSWLKISNYIGSQLATFFYAAFLLGLFDPEDGGDMFLRTFIILHGVTSQNIVLFVLSLHLLGETGKS
jgi:hypothetical protein